MGLLKQESLQMAFECLCLSKFTLPSVLWHRWLGIRKSIQPVKNWVMRCWCGYLS